MKISPDKAFPLTVEEILSPGLIALWESFNQGIMIIDKNNICLYINALQKKYDRVRDTDLVGKDFTEFYHSYPEESLTRQCITSRKPILNRLRVYKTVDGTVHQAITNVFPLFSRETSRIQAAVNFAIEMDIGRELFGLFSNARKQQKNPSRTAEDLKDFSDIIGHDTEFLETIKYAGRIARNTSSVMITGETGTGKELFAQSIHKRSPRSGAPFIPINCAAIPHHLLEGILFGTTKGAYTNAVDKAGLFELAHKGSLFLDEINSMPLELQAKLLRVIQEKKVRRIGASKETRVNVRIISSVNIDPGEAVRKNRLREDLFYRLAVIVISIPPLRRRKLDIPFLAEHFLRKLFADQAGNRVTIADEVYTLFFNYDWPGNIRELEHTIEAGASMLREGENAIVKAHLPSYFFKKYNGFKKSGGQPLEAGDSHDIAGLLRQILLREKEGGKEEEAGTPGQRILKHIARREKEDRRQLTLPELVAEFEATYIAHALKIAGGNVTQAARRMGLSGQSLHYKLKKLRIDRQKYQQAYRLPLFPD